MALDAAESQTLAWAAERRAAQPGGGRWRTAGSPRDDGLVAVAYNVLVPPHERRGGVPGEPSVFTQTTDPTDLTRQQLDCPEP